MSSSGQHVVFEQTLEGLLRGIRPLLPSTAKPRFKAVGLDIDAKLLPAYPFDVWMKVLLVSAEEVWPKEPPEQALFKVGAAFLEGYRETFLGRAVLGVFHIIGPRRAIHRASRHFRSGNNYTEARVTDVSEACVDLWMNEVGPYPTFTQGLIHSALSAPGVVPTVVVKDYDGHACTYRCSWAVTN